MEKEAIFKHTVRTTGIPQATDGFLTSKPGPNTRKSTVQQLIRFNIQLTWKFFREKKNC